MLVVACPDWQATATGISSDVPVAVVQANRIISANPTARREGVIPGLRRREAQSMCPDLQITHVDESRDAKSFEPVITAVEALAPRLEILSPGVCAVPTLGPSRYFGGDESLVNHITMLVTETLNDCGLDTFVGVGIADGMFAATLAAKALMVIPTGGSADFLAPQPVEVLHKPELVDLLKRLGLRTLGDFAALPAADVLGRFGHDGRNAQLCAQGYDEEPFQARVPPLDLAVESQLDQPIEQLDMATFAAKSLADQLHASLGSQGLACNRLLIEADMQSGETLGRIWRHDGRLSAVAIAERLRWQIEGWLTRNIGKDDDELANGISRLRLVPEGLLPDNGMQLGFWGGNIDAEERAARALSRVQSIVGEEGVSTAVIVGGRSPSAQVRYVPWGVSRESVARDAAPWPGQLPVPSPATVYDVWPTAVVRSAEGVVVGVDGRGFINAIPTRLKVDADTEVEVASWAGPWLLDERWWDPANAKRRARMQVTTINGDAYLLALEKQRWWVEARYD